MNTRRVASLHRQLAALHAELADAYEQDDPATKPKARKRPMPTAPTPEARPEVVEKVRRALRRKGIVTG